MPQQFKSGDDVRLERLIAALPKGASFTEGEAMDCLYKRGLRRTNTIINGTTPEIHQLVSHGILRWASRAPRLLERTPPAAPPRRCRSVYVPPPVVEPWAEEIATLREQLQPSTPVSVGSGPYVKNGTGWPLWSHLLGRELASGEVVEVDEETVGAITRTGVFVRCQPAEVARLLTRSRSLAKVAAR